MYDLDYDVEPDSPIIRSDAELGIDYGELKQVWYILLFDKVFSFWLFIF